MRQVKLSKSHIKAESSRLRYQSIMVIYLFNRKRLYLSSPLLKTNVYFGGK